MRNLNTTFFILIHLLLPCALGAQSLIDPLVYPYGTVGTGAPVITWQDIYNIKDANRTSQFRITITSREPNGPKPFTAIINPEIYYNNFYAFRVPVSLNNGSYEYSIERMVGAEPMKTLYYHNLNYPIKKEFTIKTDAASDIDKIPAPYLIHYLYLDRNNRLQNGYNCLFFSASGIMSFGIGVLFYCVIDFGIVSTIISAISFTSSCIGVTAACYYGYQYYQNKRKLGKILEIGTGVSLKSGVADDRVQAEMELQF